MEVIRLADHFVRFNCDPPPKFPSYKRNPKYPFLMKCVHILVVGPFILLTMPLKKTVFFVFYVCSTARPADVF
jgi:hypothetical protein